MAFYLYSTVLANHWNISVQKNLLMAPGFVDMMK
jgi:hypothetical protein